MTEHTERTAHDTLNELADVLSGIDEIIAPMTAAVDDPNQAKLLVIRHALTAAFDLVNDAMSAIPTEEEATA